LPGPTLDQAWLSGGYRRYHTHLEALVGHYRDKTLNDLPEFKTSSQLDILRGIFCERSRERIQAPNLSDVIIKMWENETTWAAYQLERSCASASSSTGA